MRLRRLLRVLAAGIGACALVATASAAGAITGGTVDDTSNPRFPAVVVIATGLVGGGSEQCTGTLVTPTKVLTAAHCVQDTVGRTIVSNQNPAQQWTKTPDGGWFAPPSPGWVMGDTVADPAFDAKFFTDDVAVVTLAAPLSGVTPMPLAPLGYNDAINARPGGIQKQAFTAVGYGTHLEKPASGPQRRQPNGDSLDRKIAELTGKTLTSQFVEAKTNLASTQADGSICYGDSGGPLLSNGRVVGVASHGAASVCQSWVAWQRTDTPRTAAFLATQGVIVPAS